MRQTVLALILSISFVGTVVADQAPKPSMPASAEMTNADVIKMTNAGLNEEIILASIQGTEQSRGKIPKRGQRQKNHQRQKGQGSDRGHQGN